MREIATETFENPPRPPWLANKQWASGRIRDSAVANFVLVWLFTLVWNAIAWILGFAVLGHIRQPSGVQWLAVGAFPFVGLLALIGAIYGTARFLKFGRSYLELETMPGRIGGWLAGTIRTAADLRDADHIRLTLRCVNRITRGSGKNSSTHESTIWEAAQVLKGAAMGARAVAGRRGGPGGGGGAGIPVAFRIPQECQPTRDGFRDDIIWRLHVAAPMPGANYAADFTVPVFEHQSYGDDFVPQSLSQVEKLRASPEEAIALDDSQIQITAANAAGRKRFVFPASRNRASATVLTMFALAFGGGGIGAIKLLDAPILFAGIFVLIGALFAYGALLYWFRHVELEVDRHGVKRAWRLLTFSGERTIRTLDIAQLQQEKTSEVNGTPYFTIYAHTSGDGRKIALISGLRSGDAEHVLGEIRSALGSATAARS